MKSGARWAYFHPSQVTVSGVTRGYIRQDKSDPSAEVHSCEICGSTTPFTLTKSAVSKFGDVQIGANMALADEGDLSGIELRFPDGRNWNGGTEFDYVREARIIGR